MNFNHKGVADRCERLLRTTLHDSPDLTLLEKERLRNVIAWHTGRRNEQISLVTWLSIIRLVGEDIATRLDIEGKHQFLRFDTDRSRTVLINPEDGVYVPIEETSISSTYPEADVSLVHADTIGKQRFGTLTAVTNAKHGTRLVYGDYIDGVNWITDNGDQVWFDKRISFSLPEPMTSDELDQWIEQKQNSDEENLLDLISQNHEQNWGKKTPNSK